MQDTAVFLCYVTLQYVVIFHELRCYFIVKCSLGTFNGSLALNRSPAEKQN